MSPRPNFYEQVHLDPATINFVGLYSCKGMYVTEMELTICNSYYLSLTRTFADVAQKILNLDIIEFAKCP